MDSHSFRAVSGAGLEGADPCANVASSNASAVEQQRQRGAFRIVERAGESEQSTRDLMVKSVV